MQYLARDHHDPARLGVLAKQIDHLGSRHGVQTIEWFVQNQDAGLVSDCLSQLDTLAHAFAVPLYRTPGSIRQVYLFQHHHGQSSSTRPAVAMYKQVIADKIVACDAGRKRIVLRAVTDLPIELLRYGWRCSTDMQSAGSRTHQPSDQVHQRRLASAVRPYHTSDTRLNLQAHTIDAQDIAVELGNIR